ncbi:MAG: hypothetical protein GY756_09970 [bacterium]|nr:hypothetical protein [bacterium]
MSTATELIRSSRQEPVRKCYIKRRNLDGSYESTWRQVDFSDGINRVVNWGNISIEIDATTNIINDFTISNLSMKFSNRDGAFSVETDSRSLWFGYLNRKYTKVKVEAGYFDTDSETEIGVVSIFEGVINSVKTNSKNITTINVFSYQSILKKYDVVDLGLSGTRSISYIVDAILNQSKIQEYFSSITISPDQDKNVANTEDLEGDYWSLLVELSFISNSVIIVDIASISFQDRTPGVSSVWTFTGVGVPISNTELDIIDFLDYDDEGADKVRVHWIAEGNTSISAKSTNATMLAKYLGEPEIINLDKIATTPEKQAIVNALLSEWGTTARPFVAFRTRFMLNFISPFDRINIDAPGVSLILDNVGIYDITAYDDDTVYDGLVGSINISSNINWFVEAVIKDIENWTTTIKARQII